MARIDLQHLRMQFEILNKSIAQIAADANTIEKGIQDIATKENWQRWFPEPDLEIDHTMTVPLTSDQMEEMADEFTKRTSLRLKMYNIVKDILLAQKYLALETRIIDEANNLLDVGDLAPRDVKALSALYAEMTKTSIRDALASFSFGDDGSGLPTVIFKNMAGTN